MIPEKTGFRLGEDPSQLPDRWFDHSAGFPIGTIGQYDSDHGSWDNFIKVWSSADENEIGVIFPRLALHDGKLLFGVDRTFEALPVREDCARNCALRNAVGDARSYSYCSCGAVDRNLNSYSSSFAEASPDEKYNVHYIKPYEGPLYPYIIWIDYPPSSRFCPDTDGLADKFYKGPVAGRK